MRSPTPAPAYPEFPHDATDPHELPDSAWLDPSTFTRAHDASGIRLGVDRYTLEAAAPEGAASGSPGGRRRSASAPPKTEPREAKSRRVYIEEVRPEEIEVAAIFPKQGQTTPLCPGPLLRRRQTPDNSGVCIRAYPNQGEQGLIDDLLGIQQHVHSVGRSALRTARQLQDSELSYESYER